MTALYHYCNSAAFSKIINSRAICLSSLTLSNDTMEGKVLFGVVRKIIANYKYDKATSDEICRVFELFENAIDGLGFCMSEVGDLLSQWRGYADDGKGFSIGFSKTYLEKLSKIDDESKGLIRLYKVIYSPEEQESAISPILADIDKDIKAGDLRIPTPKALYLNDSEYDEFKKASRYVFTSLVLKSILAIPNLFTLKEGAFSEEKEWRLLTFIMDSVLKNCMFRASSDRIIPYKVFDLKMLDVEPVSEIIIGPKNITPISTIEKMLSIYGYKDVNVIKSKTTYR